MPKPKKGNTRTPRKREALPVAPATPAAPVAIPAPADTSEPVLTVQPTQPPGVRHHPLAGRLPLGPLHPPATPPPSPSTSASASASDVQRDTRIKPNTSIADRLFTLRTNVTFAEINAQIRTPVSDDHATLAIGVTSNFLWLIKHEASKRRLKMNQLVIGLVLQALTQEPTPPAADIATDATADMEAIPRMEGAA